VNMARKLMDGFTLTAMYAVLIAVSIFMILPFIWMLNTSFKLPEDVFGLPPEFIPANPTLINYQYLFQDNSIVRIVGNTFFVAAVGTALRLFFCSLAGYAFAKAPVSESDGTIQLYHRYDADSRRGNPHSRLHSDARVLSD